MRSNYRKSSAKESSNLLSNPRSRAASVRARPTALGEESITLDKCGVVTKASKMFLHFQISRLCRAPVTQSAAPVLQIRALKGLVSSRHKAPAAVPFRSCPVTRATRSLCAARWSSRVEIQKPKTTARHLLQRQSCRQKSRAPRPRTSSSLTYTTRKSDLSGVAAAAGCLLRRKARLPSRGVRRMIIPPPRRHLSAKSRCFAAII